jgi:hypothetical protein
MDRKRCRLRANQSGSRIANQSELVRAFSCPSNRQSNVAFEHRCLQLRALSALPQCSSVQYPIPDGPPVRTFAARNGARDADKLGAHLIGRQSDLRITVSSEIDELEVRSQIRLDSDRARLRSRLFAYSKHARTPCFSSMLKVQSGFAPASLSARNSGRSGASFGSLCS